MDDCDDIVREFLAESRENLDRLDRELVELEKQPSNREILASIFRTIHSIKGTSGFLGFGKLEVVTHVGESLLARLRDGQLNLTPERTTALLAAVDAVREMLAEIQANGQDGNADYTVLVADLTRLQESSESETTGQRTSRQQVRLQLPRTKTRRPRRPPKRSDGPKTRTEDFRQRRRTRTVRRRQRPRMLQRRKHNTRTTGKPASETPMANLLPRRQRALRERMQRTSIRGKRHRKASG